MFRAKVLLLLLCAATITTQPQAGYCQTSGQPQANEPSQKEKPVERSNADVRYEIQYRYDTLPEFNGSRLRVCVDSRSVRIIGYVRSKPVHDSALSVAHTYAGKRDIRDEIRVGGSPDYRDRAFCE